LWAQGKYKKNCCTLAEEYTMLFGQHMAVNSEHGHPTATPFPLQIAVIAKIKF
jgi:hypothetical protein